MKMVSLFHGPIPRLGDSYIAIDVADSGLLLDSWEPIWRSQSQRWWRRFRSLYRQRRLRFRR